MYKRFKLCIDDVKISAQCSKKKKSDTDGFPIQLILSGWFKVVDWLF